MSQVIVDGFAFCRQAEQREGSAAIAELPRLAAETYNQQGAVHWSFRGGRHPKGYAQLNMAVTGDVALVCQRCLLPMSHAIDTQTRLVLAHDEQEADAIEQTLDDDAIDVIVGSATLDLMQLVEDEVLLSLPPSPRHPTCPDGGAAHTPGKPDSPFAVLQKLKK